MKQLRMRLAKAGWLPYAAAVIGALIYALQSWGLAHSLATLILDESMYSYKGYLFAIGQYAPYQDYGPLTNHMPLAFMIPGYIQAWFGPGMETIRVFSFLVGMIMLAGMWLAFTRAGSQWWGALIIWIFVFTPAWQEVFSQGLTQGLINAFIAWAFVFLLGENRKYWQLATAVILAVLSVMTRVNTLPILALMVVYIYWQHGWRKGLFVTFAALVSGIFILAFFWPGVLKFLSGWIPQGLFGFVEPYRSPWSQQHVPEGFSYFPLSAWIRQPNSEQIKGLLAFLEAINFNFIPVLAVVGTLVCWPRHQDWPNRYRFRVSVLLVASWIVMAGMHIWVALSGRSCHFFCLAGYFTFFNLLGLLLLPITLPYWRSKPSVWRQILAFVMLFGVVVGAFFRPGYRQVNFFRLWKMVMKLPIPRISNGKVNWGETGAVLSLFETKLNLSYQFLMEQVPTVVYWIVLFILIFRMIPFVYIVLKEYRPLNFTVSKFAIVVIIVIGLLMGYSRTFYGETPNLVCEDNVIKTHERVAEQLNEIIPSDSLVYWHLSSNMLLLYLPQAEIFPPLLNTNFNYVHRTQPEDSDLLYRFGYWDQYLKQEWLNEADFLLIAGQLEEDWLNLIDTGRYQLMGVTDPYESCRLEITTINVLKNMRKE